MASIRRTLSPYHERHYQNGGNSFSVQSPSHRSSSGKSSSPFSSVEHRLRKIMSGIFLPKISRKSSSLWRRSLYRCLICFLLGIILGVALYGDFKDERSHDFNFEIQAPFVNTEEDPKGISLPTPDAPLVKSVELGVKLEGAVQDTLELVQKRQLIVVTPTYNRILQAYYLNRLGQVLRLVKQPLLWIVVEMNTASMETAEILRKTGVMYRHLVCSKNMTDFKDRGVHQRNTALEHIEHHRLDGIVYFADDDNIYSLELFEGIREISRFGTWPVAMLAQNKNKAILEGPVCNGSQVIGWHTNEKSKKLRRFHVDMSGFAFNSTILWDAKRWHRPTSYPIRQLDTVKEGFQETTFIEQIVEDESQMEGVLPGCSRILNWHLHLEAHSVVYPQNWLLQKNLEIVLPIY